MAQVLENEIKPGMVVHLQPEVIISCGGAFVKCNKGSEVKDKHFFLIVSVDIENSECIAFPLYSQNNGSKDRVALDEGDKSGKLGHWIGVPSFYFKWQFWRIPLSSVCAASFDDDSDTATRRFYASSNPSKLDDIIREMSRSRDEWRSPV